ncbi:hypothetical protein Tco_1569798 [Tanacetum coccineum]
MIQTRIITLLTINYVQILKIPYNGQAIFTNEWDLASLEYSQETEGPYCTDLPTPDDIRRHLELERVVVDRTIKKSKQSSNPNQILTKELSPDMKKWEELIRENMFGQGGHRDRLTLVLLTLQGFYINPPLSPPPRVPPPPPTQAPNSMEITLSLSPITPLDVHHNSSSLSPPIIGHPIPWNLLEAHGDSCLCCVYNRTLIFRLRDELQYMFSYIEHMLSQPLTTIIPSPLPSSPN